MREHVRLSFAAEFRSWTALDPAPDVLPVLLGPDGVVMGCVEIEFVKVHGARMFERMQWDLLLPTKVRNLVVARWMLRRLDPQCDTLVHEGVDVRGDPERLARLLEAKTAGLARGTPSDPPEADDGGLGAGVPARPKPSGLEGEVRPDRAAEAG